MMEVEVYHTSEVMVALGSDYFLQTVKSKAVEIAQRRKESKLFVQYRDGNSAKKPEKYTSKA
jgi:prefoldin subunit 5